MLKKRFLEKICQVEFSLSTAAAANINDVYLVGDFNDWDETATPMKCDGENFTVIVELPLNEEFQFRYFVNNQDWHNDWHADAYVTNGFGGQNSVVHT